jgi:hypothetical protein
MLEEFPQRRRADRAHSGAQHGSAPPGASLWLPRVCRGLATRWLGRRETDEEVIETGTSVAAKGRQRPKASGNIAK